MQSVLYHVQQLSIYFLTFIWRDPESKFPSVNFHLSNKVISHRKYLNLRLSKFVLSTTVSHWRLKIRMFDEICTHPAHHAKGERRCLHFGGNPGSLLRDVNRDGVRARLPPPASSSSSSSQLSDGAVLPRSVSAVCGAGSSSVTPRVRPFGCTTRMSARVSSPKLANSGLVVLAIARWTKLRERATRREIEKGGSQGWLEATTTGGRALLTKSSRRSYLSTSLSPFRALFLYPSFLPPLPLYTFPATAPTPSRFQSRAHPLTREMRASARAFSRDLLDFLPFRCFPLTFVRAKILKKNDKWKITNLDTRRVLKPFSTFIREIVYIYDNNMKRYPKTNVH